MTKKQKATMMKIRIPKGDTKERRKTAHTRAQFPAKRTGKVRVIAGDDVHVEVELGHALAQRREPFGGGHAAANVSVVAASN
jgi:hypothetical protein